MQVRARAIRNCAGRHDCAHATKLTVFHRGEA
jgi:hypothetical protein